MLVIQSHVFRSKVIGVGRDNDVDMKSWQDY